MEGEYHTKRISYRESLVQASRLRSVQVLDPEGPRKIASTYNQERRVGHVDANHLSETLVVEYDSEKVTLDEIRKKIKGACP